MIDQSVNYHKYGLKVFISRKLHYFCCMVDEIIYV